MKHVANETTFGKEEFKVSNGKITVPFSDIDYITGGIPRYQVHFKGQLHSIHLTREDWLELKRVILARKLDIHISEGAYNLERYLQMSLEDLVKCRDVLRDRISQFKFPCQDTEDLHVQLREVEEKIKENQYGK